VLLRPLPYSDSGQLIMLFEDKLQEGVKGTGCSYPDFEQWRAQSHAFSGIAGTTGHSLTLTGRGEASRRHHSSRHVRFLFSARREASSGSHLHARRRQARRRARRDPRRKFLAQPVRRRPENPRQVGHSRKASFTVVGVMPASFRPPPFDGGRATWIPLVQDPLFGPWMPQRGGHWLALVVRMKPGISDAQA
jgi:hypothetical protein